MATSFASTTFSPAPARGRPARDLATARLVGFSTLAAPIAAAQVPITNFLPAIYAQEFGISLAVLGTIFLVERLWGAFADPLVGALSDRTRSRFGRRKPWIAAGGVLYGLATIALFFPPAGIASRYLGIALFAFYLGWSMIQIPYLAWSGEISGEYHERTRIATYVTVAGSIALLLVLLLPALIEQVRPQDGTLKLAAMGSVILLTLLPAAWLTLRAFPEAPVVPVSGPRERPGLVATLRFVLGEKLLLRVLLSDLAVTFGQGVRGTLFLFVVSFYMGLPQWGALLMLSQFVFGIAAGPIWMTIARRFGKHRTAIAGELAQVAINLGLLAIAPGTLALLIGLTVAQGLAQGSGNLMLRAMVADIADHHRLRTGHDRTALFFSSFSLSMKAGTALAVGIALPLVALAGFDPAAARNSPQALQVLLVIFALGPALAHLCSAALLRGFPLDEEAHAAVRRELDRRRAHAAAA
ncbi:MFS transporter [Novosphingobium album (ex Liu et al. 2023)]|uniref:MFS transporter n=1 Tax=Novosphingobium album (ex Liu et al. 2023) TaxID=3031130 RepID=A0ABT5WN69_9SPHN|nr:MFS transporter [Novosphingobium album (ex Liu et al. 2023)]MDE8651488.1 MFS transporter [Novosphingobium album (ex Liu et al. 2023)]